MVKCDWTTNDRRSNVTERLNSEQLMTEQLKSERLMTEWLKSPIFPLDDKTQILWQETVRLGPCDLWGGGYPNIYCGFIQIKNEGCIYGWLCYNYNIKIIILKNFNFLYYYFFPMYYTCNISRSVISHSVTLDIRSLVVRSH